MDRSIIQLLRTENTCCGIDAVMAKCQIFVFLKSKRESCRMWSDRLIVMVSDPGTLRTQPRKNSILLPLTWTFILEVIVDLENPAVQKADDICFKVGYNEDNLKVIWVHDGIFRAARLCNSYLP